MVVLNEKQTKALTRLLKKIEVKSVAFEGNGNNSVILRVEDQYGWSANVMVDVDGIPTNVKTGKGLNLPQESLQELFVEDQYDGLLNVPGVDPT